MVVGVHSGGLRGNGGRAVGIAPDGFPVVLQVSQLGGAGRYIAILTGFVHGGFVGHSGLMAR